MGQKREQLGNAELAAAPHQCWLKGLLPSSSSELLGRIWDTGTLGPQEPKIRAQLLPPPLKHPAPRWDGYFLSPGIQDPDLSPDY